MHTVICAFDDRQQAERAVKRLVQEGVALDHVHVESGREGAPDSTTAVSPVDDDHGVLHRIEHFFAELFGDKDDTRTDARRYSEAWRRGGTVVVVDVDDEAKADQVRATLESAGGTIDMEQRASMWRSEGWADDEPRQGMSSDGSEIERAKDATRNQGETVVPVVQEEVQIGKREVQRGGVRIIRRMTEQPVKELVRLREERAVVERRPVDRPATEADLQALREGTLEVRETAEEPVVSKAARVVEEVVVGKKVQERTQAVEDTVRRTEVQLDQLGSQESPLEADDEQATRTRIRGATEDAGEATGAALKRAGRKVADVAKDVKDEATGKKP